MSKYIAIALTFVAVVWPALCIATHHWQALAAFCGAVAPGVAIYCAGAHDFKGWDWMWRKDKAP